MVGSTLRKGTKPPRERPHIELARELYRRHPAALGHRRDRARLRLDQHSGDLLVPRLDGDMERTLTMRLRERIASRAEQRRYVLGAPLQRRLA